MKIGLTQRIFYHRQRAYDSLEHGWYTLLNGHTLSPIANNVNQDFNSIADSIDALVITGGDDSATRRVVELKLGSAMLLRQKPILGVCHGAFLLTDVLGGVVMDCCTSHRDTEHRIVMDQVIATVNSFHDLQIKSLHSSATVLATDEDGYCESWQDKNIFGVVWHPERMTSPILPAIIKNTFSI